MVGKQYQVKWTSHTSTFVELLNYYRYKELYCDASLACHGHVYPVHQVVLSASSKFFSSVFAQTATNQQPVVVLQGAERTEVESLLEFMYTGRVTVSRGRLQELLRVATSLQVKGLAEATQGKEGEIYGGNDERTFDVEDGVTIDSKEREAHDSKVGEAFDGEASLERNEDDCGIQDSLGKGEMECRNEERLGEVKFGLDENLRKGEVKYTNDDKSLRQREADCSQKVPVEDMVDVETMQNQMIDRVMMEETSDPHQTSVQSSKSSQAKKRLQGERFEAVTDVEVAGEYLLVRRNRDKLCEWTPATLEENDASCHTPSMAHTSLQPSEAPKSDPYTSMQPHEITQCDPKQHSIWLEDTHTSPQPHKKASRQDPSYIAYPQDLQILGVPRQDAKHRLPSPQMDLEPHDLRYKDVRPHTTSPHSSLPADHPPLCDPVEVETTSKGRSRPASAPTLRSPRPVALDTSHMNFHTLCEAKEEPPDMWLKEEEEEEEMEHEDVEQEEEEGRWWPQHSYTEASYHTTPTAPTFIYALPSSHHLTPTSHYPTPSTSPSHNLILTSHLRQELLKPLKNISPPSSISLSRSIHANRTDALISSSECLSSASHPILSTPSFHKHPHSCSTPSHSLAGSPCSHSTLLHPLPTSSHHSTPSHTSVSPLSPSASLHSLPAPVIAMGRERPPKKMPPLVKIPSPHLPAVLPVLDPSHPLEENPSPHPATHIMKESLHTPHTHLLKKNIRGPQTHLKESVRAPQMHIKESVLPPQMHFLSSQPSTSLPGPLAHIPDTSDVPLNLSREGRANKDPFLGKIATKRKRRLRGPKCWEYLARLLADPTTNPSLVRWENREAGVFRLVQPGAVARRWGRRAGKHANDALTYENFARGLRYHYATGALQPVSERSFVYKFGPKALRALLEGTPPALVPSSLPPSPPPIVTTHCQASVSLSLPHSFSNSPPPYSQANVSLPLAHCYPVGLISVSKSPPPNTHTLPPVSLSVTHSPSSGMHSHPAVTFSLSHSPAVSHTSLSHSPPTTTGIPISPQPLPTYPLSCSPSTSPSISHSVFVSPTPTVPSLSHSLPDS